MEEHLSVTEDTRAAKILLVEDHEFLRHMMREWLAGAFPQSSFIEASTGEEAITLIDQEKPQLVVTDINMPGVDGLELTQRVKRDLPSIEVVVVSSHDDDLHREKASACGASAYVPKHTMITELIPTLNALMRHEIH